MFVRLRWILACLLIMKGDMADDMQGMSMDDTKDYEPGERGR